MSYVYRISFMDYEGSSQYELEHDTLFSEQQFDSMIVEACLDIVNKAKAKRHYLHSFDEIIWDVVRWLRDKKGFREFEYDAAWDCGYGSMFVIQEEPNIAGDKINILANALRSAGYSEMDDSRLRRDIEYKRLNKMSVSELRAEYPDVWREGVDKIHYILRIVDYILYGRMPK